MRYILKKVVIAQVPTIDLSKAEYESIKKSRNILTNALAMEEKYDLVVSNYMDFEMALLDSTVKSMIRLEYTHESFFLITAHLNKTIVNLLTAARMYVDQLHRHVGSALPENSNVKQQVQQLFSREYDGCFEYRFVEALRNSVQHFGFAVHWTEFPCGWEGSGEERRLRFSVEIASHREKLQEDDDFKKSVLDETPVKVNLKEAIRKYVEAISRVHDSARTLVEQSLGTARSAIEIAISKYQKEFTGSIAGLSAFCMSDEDEELERVPVMLEWDNIRVQLMKRNPFLANLSKRYVSNQIRLT